MDDSEISDQPLEPPGSHQGRCARLIVDVIDTTRSAQQSRSSYLKSMLAQAGDLLGVHGEIRIKLVHDDEMSHAHQQYKGIPSTTDVLTFDLRDDHPTPPPENPVLDTDLLVCVDQAQRQATARGIDLQRELLLYSIHGLLHCLNYDDTSTEKAQAMHAKEDQLLIKLGVGATFTLNSINTEESEC